MTLLQAIREDGRVPQFAAAEKMRQVPMNREKHGTKKALGFRGISPGPDCLFTSDVISANLPVRIPMRL